MENKRMDYGKIFVGGAFVFFLIITSYRLTNASLWFDEVVEYWYSKVMFGKIPYESTANMYERIISTFQPPLYNFLMFFWLKISENEWWFRFFGVVMGFIGMVGLYKCTKKICSNEIIAGFAVIVGSCTYQLLYYWQECSEYCLMLGSLFWTIYFWISLLQESSRKNIIGFTVTAIIPVYSQYGAGFPVLAMILVAFFVVVLKKEKKPLKEITVSYIIALIVAAVPLYVFFLRKQMLNQQGGGISSSPIVFEKNFIYDCIKNLGIVFKWNFLSYYTDIAAWLLLGIILVIFAIVAVKGKDFYRWIVFTNVLTWILYYFAVKIGVYAYGGNVGSRYNLFFIPLWMVSNIAVGFEFYNIICSIPIIKKFGIQFLCTGTVIGFFACFCMWSWTAKIQPNWQKENNRGVVNAWYEQEAFLSNTLVYYGADPGFAYYVRKNADYNEDTVKNVTYMPWYRDKTGEEYTQYLNDIYGLEWPKELYIVGVHTRDDINTLTNQLVARGWIREDVYNSGAILIKLTYDESLPHIETKTATDSSTIMFKISNVDKCTDIQLPIWSIENGQDDLVWYNAESNGDGTWTCVVKTENHLSELKGSITVHVYGKSGENKSRELLRAYTLEI